MTFFNIFLSNVFINFDHGSLPGCASEIKDELNMNDFEFGLLGSVVYGGLTIGAGVASGVYQHSNWAKPTLISTLFMNSVFIFVFAKSKSFYLDGFLRFCLGFF